MPTKPKRQVNEPKARTTQPKATVRIAPPSGLTPKQLFFVQEYLVDLNSTAAARRAGYSSRNADKIGPELLGKTRVAEAIQLAFQARSERTEIDADYVLLGLKAEAEADRPGSSPSARVRALELLGRHLGLFVDHHEHRHGGSTTAPPIQVEQASVAEIDEFLNQLSVSAREEILSVLERREAGNPLPKPAPPMLLPCLPADSPPEVVPGPPSPLPVPCGQEEIATPKESPPCFEPDASRTEEPQRRPIVFPKSLPNRAIFGVPERHWKRF